MKTKKKLILSDKKNYFTGNYIGFIFIPIPIPFPDIGSAVGEAFGFVVVPAEKRRIIQKNS